MDGVSQVKREQHFIVEGEEDRRFLGVLKGRMLGDAGESEWEEAEEEPERPFPKYEATFLKRSLLPP